MGTHVFPEGLSQNNRLSIRIVSPDFGHLTPGKEIKQAKAGRLPYYFFLFLIDGASQHVIDTHTFSVEKNDLLFALPHQIQQMPPEMHGKNYYKLGFDEECLSRLPRQYSFLLSPLNKQKINLTTNTAARVSAIFEILLKLLSCTDTDAELILAHLNSLLTEINIAYADKDTRLHQDGISKFVDFKIFVENNLTDHPTITQISEALAVSTDSLYKIVKDHSGQSPKEFIINRLILEARRRLHYQQRSSVKELAFDLGFNDPDYFSRLFKKVTGKTVAGFFKDLS
jgi:AraC family transcriptional regulator, transcriptional activator of pobA